MAYQITREKARRFLLRRHGLLGEKRFRGADGVCTFVRLCGCVQFDPVDVCGRSPDISLFSRVEGYEKSVLRDLLYRDRALVEYFDKNLALIPVSDWRYFSRVRAGNQNYWRMTAEMEEAADKIRGMIARQGPLNAKDIDMDARVDWMWGRKAKLSSAVLEAMYLRGELGVHHRERSIRWYDLIENLIPREELDAADPNSTDEALFRWWVLRRVGAVGLLWNRASDAWLGVRGMKAGERGAAFQTLLSEGELTALTVEGLRCPLYMKSCELPLLEEACAGARYEPRMEFLAPLDAFLWDRKLIEALFDFSYKWEIYTPREKRKYGHYTLPVLFGERLVGRTEMACDRAAGVLEVKDLWLEDGVSLDAALRKSLSAAYARFAAFNECDAIRNLIF